MPARERLKAFIAESNRIEGIKDVLPVEVSAHRDILDRSELTVGDVERFVNIVASATLREQVGMDVRVGAHLPPPGGPDIRGGLAVHLGRVEKGALSPYLAHVAYEQLHPFMDGNGRSGRVLWAWQMQRDGLDPFSLPFLHRFYYQALDASRS